jgi:hypothetical protein
MLKQRRSRRGRARNTKTMLTCRLLPPRLTEPEIGRSVLPPCRLTDQATPQRGRFESQSSMLHPKSSQRARCCV